MVDSLVEAGVAADVKEPHDGLPGAVCVAAGCLEPSEVCLVAGGQKPHGRLTGEVCMVEDGQEPHD